MKHVQFNLKTAGMHADFSGFDINFLIYEKYMSVVEVMQDENGENFERITYLTLYYYWRNE